MSQGRRYAVLIGSSRFEKEPKLSSLKCPENDVDGMREVLSAVELGAFEEPFVFKNVENYAVLHRLEEVLADATSEDQVLIYYSGHGKTDLPGRLYLATANTEIKKLVATSIPIETLRLMIENSSCRKIILILDCCYGGAAGKSFTRGEVDDKLQDLARGNGVYILTASTAAQTALEREGDDYGLLTKHILSGIRQGDADINGDGLISLEDLYKHVYTRVKNEGYQEPMRWALNVKGEELIIARAVRAFSAERLKVFKQTLLRIESEIDEDVFEQAYRVIRENQPKRDKEHFALLEDLCEGRLPVGKFGTNWLKLKSARQAQSKPASEPRKDPPTLLKPQNPRQAEVKENTPPPARSAPGSSGQSLDKVSFETVTLDASGKETSRRQLQADCFVEDLDGVALEMICIPGGSFMMGAPAQEAGRTAAEGPQHLVQVPEFFMGRYQITREQWRQVARMPKVKLDLSEDPSSFKDSLRQPVENISWQEAVEFCERLKKKTGRAYRLPAEAEWEYACRAGTTGPFAFGETCTPKLVNYDGNHPYALAAKGKYRKKTVEVGSLGIANPLGLFDMHGNVWEWCQDVWHDSYNGVPTNGSAWLSGGSYSPRVLRGGSWFNISYYCRSAARYANGPDARSNYVGFRVVVGARVP